MDVKKEAGSADVGSVSYSSLAVESSPKGANLEPVPSFSSKNSAGTPAGQHQKSSKSAEIAKEDPVGSYLMAGLSSPDEPQHLQPAGSIMKGSWAPNVSHQVDGVRISEFGSSGKTLGLLGGTEKFLPDTIDLM